MSWELVEVLIVGIAVIMSGLMMLAGQDVPGLTSWELVAKHRKLFGAIIIAIGALTIAGELLGA